MSLNDLHFGQRITWRRSATECYPAEIVDIEHTGAKVQIRVCVPNEVKRLWWVRLDELSQE